MQRLRDEQFSVLWHELSTPPQVDGPLLPLEHLYQQRRNNGEEQVGLVLLDSRWTTQKMGGGGGNLPC